MSFVVVAVFVVMVVISHQCRRMPSPSPLSLSFVVSLLLLTLLLTLLLLTLLLFMCVVFGVVGVVIGVVVGVVGDVVVGVVDACSCLVKYILQWTTMCDDSYLKTQLYLLYLTDNWINWSVNSTNFYSLTYVHPYTQAYTADHQQKNAVETKWKY